MANLLINRWSNIFRFNSVICSGVSDVLYTPSRNVWGNVNTRPPRGKNRPNKHVDPKYSKLRAAKVLKVDLPDIDIQRKIQSEQLSPEEIRAYMKKEGILPPKDYQEKPFFLTSTGSVIEPYVPPEGDGKASFLSKQKVTETKELVKTKTKTFTSMRKIKTFDDDFTTEKFLDEAHNVYIKAHEALARKDEKGLHHLATEKMFPEMMFNTERKSIYWEFLKSLEPPRLVHARAIEVISPKNYFAQITVRFNSQQILAVYDRFGRLIHGNPVVAKDVLEYVVFEKHIADDLGRWRMHAKIIPEWLAVERPSSLLTQVLPKTEEQEEDSKDELVEKSEEDNENVIYDKMGRKVGRSS